MDTIILSSKKELDIYVNPQRQKLLRYMRIAGIPMTPKQLSDKMGISASAIQHHIKKLLELGVVELSHTERIRGITASYYYVPPKTISMGGMISDENNELRVALMQNSIADVFSGFTDYVQKGTLELAIDEQHGDLLSGVIRVTPEQAKNLYSLIRAFLNEHEQKEQEGTPWEYALLFYPASEGKDA